MIFFLRNLSFNAASTTALLPTASSGAPSGGESGPEVDEFRREVNVSREQTRMQCKQLHDLDLRMRQSEQSLMSREQELQQLLEQLYIQEIYADNAIESAITSTPASSTTTSTSTCKSPTPNNAALLSPTPKVVNQQTQNNGKFSSLFSFWIKLKQIRCVIVCHID